MSKLTRPLRLLSGVALLACALAAGPAQGANIVWVSDNPNTTGFTLDPIAGTGDDGFVTMLQAAGHNVIRFSSDNSQNTLLTQEYIDALNTNDLIIVGRSAGSGAFQAPQGNQWNTNITVPMLCQNAYLARNSRFGWFSGSDDIVGVRPMPLTVVSPLDPANAYLFGEVSLSGAVMVDNYDVAMGQNTSQINPTNPPMAGARVLATGLDTNAATVNVMVEYPSGTTVKGEADTLSSYRLYFASGNRERSGGAVSEAGSNNLSSAGQKIFLRAVNLALNSGVPPNLGDPPVFTTEPASTGVCSGATLTLTSLATGQDPLYYQWYFNDAAIPGATTPTLSFNPYDATNAGNYIVVVSNAVGGLTAITSAVAVVTTTGTATLAAGPDSQTVCLGASANFTTTATGSGTLTYTWRKGDTILQGPNDNNSFSIAAVTPADAGAYSVTVVGDCNSVSNAFTLAVIEAPVITTQPQSQSTPMGNGAAFTVAATAVAAPTYLWKTNGVEVTGATDATLTLSGLTLADSGMTVQCIASTCAGPTASDVATLTVTPVGGISFDFDTPGQYTNAPHYMVYNDWLLSNPFNTPITVFESPIGGTGPFPGSGALDFIPNNGTDNTMLLLPSVFDFSLPGKSLTASIMFKSKNPTSNSRSTQFGFITYTNFGINDNTPQAFMTVILQSTAQPAPTYQFRAQRRNSTGGLQESTFDSATLTVSNWYKLTATFINTKDVTPNTYTINASLQDMGPLGTTPGDTILSFSTTTNNCDIVDFKNVYLAVRGWDNTGVDFRDNVYAYSTAGSVFMVASPASQTVLHGRKAIFKAYADGEGPYAYQWEKSTDGGTTFVPIADARNWKYMLNAITADNDAQFRVVVTGPANSVTSDPATLTVTPDELAVVGAGSVDGTTVGVEFNQPVDPVTAANPANYSIDGTPAVAARVYKTGLGPLGLDGIYVVLTPATILNADFALAVTGVKDLSGNNVGAANSAAGYFAGLTGVDIDPAVTAPAGEHYCFGPGKFIIMGGGTDIWNVADKTHYVYREIAGDFDLVTRVPYLDIVRSPSKAGFHVRRSLDPFDQMVSALLNPMWPGRDYPEGSQRVSPNVAATSWGSTPTRNNAWYPDAWLRLRRTGNTFLRYTGTDGVNWQLDGQVSLELPESLYVGLAVCSVANNVMCNAQFESVGEFAGYSGATIAITTQPAGSTIDAGASATLNIVATLTGGPANGELAYVWQRSDGQGGWVNLPSAGQTNEVQNTGPLYFADDGAQYRCIVRAPGATEVISDTVTITVTDTTAPTITSVGVPVTGVLPSYPASEVVVNFSEPVSEATALDVDKYTVTGPDGTDLTITGAFFLNGDPRTVVLTVDGLLGNGTATVDIDEVEDLNGNALAPVSREFRTFNPPTAPVVVEVYQDIGNATAITGLTGHALFTAGTPTFIVYSNYFGVNVKDGFGSIQDNYGARAYTYFVPPTDGQYKFWIRSDDSAQLWMNTNGVAADPIPSSVNSPSGQRAVQAVDNNTSTKYLNFDKVNTGFAVTLNDSATVTGLRFTTANDAPERDPLTFTLEGTTGSPVTGPWTMIATGSTGMDTDPGRTTTLPDVTFANATAYTSYRITFPTIRNYATANSMQIAEVEFLDAGGVDVTQYPNTVLITERTGASGPYTVGSTPATAITNITLVAGKPYYMEVLLKEGGGGDGFSVTWTAPGVNTAPATSSLIPTANLAYPVSAAPATPAVMELYTGYNNFIAGYNTLAGLYAATNYPTGTYPLDSLNFNYIAGAPAIIGYQEYMGVQPAAFTNTRYDNYLGRLISYFIAPSNGLYRFYIAVDDVAQLWMNTNAVNSTDPAGKVLLGQSANGYVSTASQLVAQNVPLVGGQKYYLEALWREGGGGDGVRVAVRSQNDGGVPPTSEIIPASMLEYPLPLGRAGAVNFTHIASSYPQPEDASSTTVPDGQSVALCVAGLSGTYPYGGFTWTKNGVVVLNNSFTNLTLPLTLADDGAVYTVTVTNAFSAVTRSITVNVTADAVAPTVVRTTGWRYNDGFTIQFSEPVDAATATFLGNYEISGGIALLSAALDQTRTQVSIQTSPQAMDTVYTVTINGVKDASSAGNVIAADTTATFSTWSLGGTGYLVEMWTNLNGGAIVDLTQQPKFVANLPDITYYTNVFGVGTFGANSGREYYGARISGFFVPTNTGYYRFYLRSDDASQLWLNPNGADPAGREMLIHVYGANITMQHPTAISPPVPLVQGERYYIEALMKEGTGGDYVMATFRNTDDNGTAVGATVPPADAATELFAAAQFGGAVPGDPGAITIVSTPPSDLTVTELTPVTLELVANVPPTAQFATTYQWQKWDGAVFADIPGATSPRLEFTALLTDDGAQYRVQFSAPGVAHQDYVTTLHVTPDTEVPSMLSAGSMNGQQVAILWKKGVNTNQSASAFNILIRDGNGTELASLDGTPLDDQRTVLINLTDPITTPTFSAEIRTGGQVCSVATTPVCADVNSGVSVTGRVEYLDPLDIGTTGDPLVVGLTYTVTNNWFSSKGGGSDVWGTADHMQMAYRAVTGDFDIKTRVESDVGPGAWSKAGLMIRGSTNANARNMFLAVTPNLLNVPTGANRYQFAWRDTDGASTAWASEAAIVPPYPNAWIRLQRVGSVINAYWGENGVDWTSYMSRDTAGTGIGGGAYPDTMLVGLFIDAGNNTDPNGAQAEFRDVDFPLAPVITTQPGPTPQVVDLHDPIAISGVAVTGTGPFTYQWRKDGLDVPGANTATLNIADSSVADSGVYTLRVGNNGGVTTSDPVVVTVVNLPPVVVNETNTISQDTILNIPVGDLIANDSDPEGDPIGIYAVSGVPPATFSANFDDGLVPAGTAVYGSGGGGYVAATDGIGGTGCLKLTDNVNSESGAFVINQLTPGKRVSAFIASFKLRIGNGSGNGADGFSFNFAPNLPDAVSGGEEGVGNGLSVCVDNYPTGGADAPSIKLKWNGALIVPAILTPKWNSTEYVPFNILLTPDGDLTVTVSGTNVVENLATGYTPIIGRFGFYARTGGENQTHWVDDISITALTVDTARGYALGGTLYGTSYTAAQGGVADSPHLRLTDNYNNQSGSLVLDELTPGAAVSSFTASFKLRIGDGTANGADGFSINLASNLPDSAAVPGGAAEEGAGTGLSLCVDNYPTGGTDAPSFKLKWGGTLLGFVLIPKWNSPNWVPIQLKMDADGTLDVVVDGTNVVADLPTPYTPVAGRFGFYARTGGQNETHWLDDISIDVMTTMGYPAFYRQDFNQGGPGTVTMAAGVVTYTPPPSGCGSDKFYYIVSDGQVNGLSVAEKTIVIQDISAQPPVIATCLPDFNLPGGAECTGLVPDLTRSVVATDNCCCLAVTQTPVAGTVVNPGVPTLITLTVTDTAGLTAQCTANMTVVDLAPPALTCAPDGTITADETGQALLPVLGTATELCSLPATVTQNPAAGTLVPVGVTTVTITAADALNNSTQCEVKVTVVPKIAIVSDGVGGLSLHWPANMPPVAVQFTTDLTPPAVWADLDPQPTPVAQLDGSFLVPLPPNTGALQVYYKVRGQ